MKNKKKQPIEKTITKNLNKRNRLGESALGMRLRHRHRGKKEKASFLGSIIGRPPPLSRRFLADLR